MEFRVQLLCQYDRAVAESAAGSHGCLVRDDFRPAVLTFVHPQVVRVNIGIVRGVSLGMTGFRSVFTLLIGVVFYFLAEFILFLVKDR